MSTVYAPTPAYVRPVHNGRINLQVVYEALIGRRPSHIRRRLFAHDITTWRLDPALHGGRVVRVHGTVNGLHAWLSLVVALPDGTCRAVSVEVDRTYPQPIRSAVIL